MLWSLANRYSASQKGFSPRSHKKDGRSTSVGLPFLYECEINKFTHALYLPLHGVVVDMMELLHYPRGRSINWPKAMRFSCSRLRR